MHRLLLVCALLCALAACASHPCGGRLTPINRPALRRSLPRSPAARAQPVRAARP